MKAGILTFSGDDKFYVEVEATSRLPNLERFFYQNMEIWYLRRGYPTKEEALKVAEEIRDTGVLQREELDLKEKDSKS